MKSILLPGKAVATFDGEIVATLKLKDSDAKAVKAERMNIAVRNEDGEIYRVFGVTGLDKFLGAINKMVKLGFTDELEDADGPRGGIDAIFSR